MDSKLVQHTDGVTNIDTGDAGAVRHRMTEESKSLARRATQIFNRMIVSPRVAPRATSIKRFNLTGA